MFGVGGKTLEKGRESGGESDHVPLGGEKSGNTSWKQWHFTSLLVKSQGEDGEGNHSRSCVDISVQTAS